MVDSTVDDWSLIVGTVIHRYKYVNGPPIVSRKIYDGTVSISQVRRHAKILSMFSENNDRSKKSYRCALPSLTSYLKTFTRISTTQQNDPLRPVCHGQFRQFLINETQNFTSHNNFSRISLFNRYATSYSANDLPRRPLSVYQSIIFSNTCPGNAFYR